MCVLRYKQPKIERQVLPLVTTALPEVPLGLLAFGSPLRLPGTNQHLWLDEISYSILGVHFLAEEHAYSDRWIAMTTRNRPDGIGHRQQREPKGQRHPQKTNLIDLRL